MTEHNDAFIEELIAKAKENYFIIRLKSGEPLHGAIFPAAPGWIKLLENTVPDEKPLYMPIDFIAKIKEFSE